ncbi:MAG: hypothetical protein WCL44_14660, partial [bacterium]
DACVEVDGNGDPDSDPRTPKLPTGMLFSDGTNGPPYDYRESLSKFSWTSLNPTNSIYAIY